MNEPIKFPYKVYKNFPCPIIPVALSGRSQWFETEAYVDSGASISIFSPIDAQRIGLDYTKGRRIYSTVGDGSLIPVFLHELKAKIGDVPFTATIGFSSKLGVGFNLIGRRDFFTAFDILFSDTDKIITFLRRS